MKKSNEPLLPLVPLDLACIAGIEDGRAKGKSHNICDSPEDLILMAAEELRDTANYLDGRLDQPTTPRLRERLLDCRTVVATAYRILSLARDAEREGR